jgi:hypothetical protein
VFNYSCSKDGALVFVCLFVCSFFTFHKMINHLELSRINVDLMSRSLLWSFQYKITLDKLSPFISFRSRVQEILSQAAWVTGNYYTNFLIFKYLCRSADGYLRMFLHLPHLHIVFGRIPKRSRPGELWTGLRNLIVCLSSCRLLPQSVFSCQLTSRMYTVTFNCTLCLL